MIELLEARTVPAGLFWQNHLSDNDGSNAANWDVYINSELYHQLPQAGDVIYFGGSVLGVPLPNDDCYDLPANGTYWGILVNYAYTSTVTMDDGVSLGLISMSTGTISGSGDVTVDTLQVNGGLYEADGVTGVTTAQNYGGSMDFNGGADIDTASFYDGYASFGEASSIEILSLTGTDIAQSEDADLTITDQMTWDEGDINAAGNVAALILDDAVATVEPESAGTLALGSSISMVNGAMATFGEGTIETTSDGVGIVVEEDCGLIAAPGEGNEVEFTLATGVTNPGPLEIKAGGFHEVESGAYETQYRRVRNVGGRVTVFADASLSIQNNSGAAYYQSSGTTELYGGSNLSTPSNKVVSITGGDLVTVASYTADVTISTEKLDFGGNLRIGTGSSTHVFGTLTVIGDVEWYDGSYSPYVTGTVDYGAADLWKATGQFIITGYGLDLIPTSIDTDFAPTTATSGYHWYVCQGATYGISRQNGWPNIGPFVWTADEHGFYVRLNKV